MKLDKFNAELTKEIMPIGMARTLFRNLVNNIVGLDLTFPYQTLTVDELYVISEKHKISSLIALENSEGNVQIILNAELLLNESKINFYDNFTYKIFEIKPPENNSINQIKLKEIFNIITSDESIGNFSLLTPRMVFLSRAHFHLITQRLYLIDTYRFEIEYKICSHYKMLIIRLHYHLH